ncbi:Hypothetical predicted protein [Octopus vulgaris]|uniref:Helitron helicase-like domain-containing protein n=1 Tax=Octopus vulgaris TaxID=6645 RepID=A0AA36BUC0_OCTVU|nr:Hypothetical predicted protein [Octopus vulgaris]
MDSVCQFCSGKHFSAEKPSDGRFNNCCHKGKILRPIRREFPPYLVSLLSDQNHPHYRNFQENIRSYNSSLSFTSMGAQLQNPPEKGPSCFRVHGQIYHRASHIYPNEGKQRQYAQLYVVDSTQATEIRAQDHVNSGCLQEVLKNLINIILKDNVYAQCFQTLREIEVQEEQLAQEENIDMPCVNLVFNRDRINDRRRYNLPTVNEIAIVFRNEEGEPPFHRDFKVYPRNSEVPTLNLDILSPELDPMTYVLFFPHGEPGWQPHTAGNREDQQRQNISMLQHKISLTAVRDNEFNPLLHGGKLFQQWVVDSYLQVEAYNLNFIRTQQNHLKVEQHQGFADHLTNAGNTEDARIGWTGSARNLKEQYRDALAIEQPVYFEEGQERQALERAAQHNTPLTAWFLLNQNDENARQYLYADIPYHYVYNKKMMQWTPRQRGADKIISEMYSVDPKYQERFYMRLLLLHVKGSRSFEELKTVDDVICGSYKEAAERRQLVQNDDEWRRCLEEASLTNMPQELRQLFAHICIFNNPVNPDVLFNSFEESLIEDFLTNHSRTISVQLALREIETTLSLHGLTCQELHLPIDDMSLTEAQNVKQIQDNLEVEA